MNAIRNRWHVGCKGVLIRSILGTFGMACADFGIVGTHTKKYKKTYFLLINNKFKTKTNLKKKLYQSKFLLFKKKVLMKFVDLFCFILTVFSFPWRLPRSLADNKHRGLFWFFWTIYPTQWRFLPVLNVSN